MFILANKYVFVPDSKMCWLSAHVNSNNGAKYSVTWSLKAHSKASPIQFPQGHDQGEGKPESVAFGIECNGLSFDVLDWKQLEGRAFDLDPTLIAGGFLVFQWEEISSLRLDFRRPSGDELELQAQGRGYIESVPELFGTAEIEFWIHTRLKFTGVHIEVPINAAAPIPFAECMIKQLLPKYDHTAPRLIETKDGNRLLGIGVHFPPKGTASGIVAPNN